MTLDTIVFPIAGKGTRLGDLSKNTHKSLLVVDGKPLLEHAIENALSLGFEKFIFIVGHLHHQIRKFLIEKYARLDSSIFYQQNATGLIDALCKAREKLAGRPFAVYCPDNYFLSLFDLKRAITFYNNCLGSVILLKKSNDFVPGRAFVGFHEKEIFSKNPIRINSISFDHPSPWQSTGFSIENEWFFSYVSKFLSHLGEARIASVWQMQQKQGQKIYGVITMGKIFDITSEKDLIFVQNRKKKSGVCCIVKDAKDQFVLIKRSKNLHISYPGYWGLCGGRVEPEERPIESIQRELKEELGLEVETSDLTFLEKRSINDVNEHMFVLKKKININNITLGEGEKLGKFSFEELKKINFRDDEFSWIIELAACI